MTGVLIGKPHEERDIHREITCKEMGVMSL